MSDQGSNSALWDQRRAKVKGNIAPIDRWCIYCHRDATPRWLYCSDECSQLSHADTVASRLASKK